MGNTKHIILTFFCAFYVLFSGVMQAHALTIKDVRVGLHPDKTRMVLDLDEASKFKTFVLENPWRLIVDMPSFERTVDEISKPSTSCIKGFLVL